MIKIVPVDSSGNAVTQLAQWDRGVTICLSHELITDAHPVHFQSARTAEAIVMESTYEDDVLSVEVPDVLLERNYPITGFVFVSESDDSGRSLLVFEIQVRPRQKPADTVYENTQEYLTVSSLLEQLTEATETAQTAAESATESSGSASDAASEATAAAEAAAASATAAAESATGASTSETNAAASAESAAASAEAAAEYSGGIVSIEQTVLTTESSGQNTVTVTKADGTTTDFYVYNGAKGDTGNLCWATFDVVATTGELELTMPDDFAGLEFAIDSESGYLEVTYA